MNELMMFLSGGGINKGNFCSNPDIIKILNFVGLIVTIIRWGIPVLLIILGTVDVGKAVVSGDDKKQKAAYNTFLKRLMAAIVVFFIPAIVKLMLNTFTNPTDPLSACTTAILGEGIF